MRRLIIGAVAVVTGLLAAVGIGITRRRRGRDEVLPVEPAPPLGASADAESIVAADASVEADFGAVAMSGGGDAVAEVDPSAPPKRKPRVRRKRPKVVEPDSAMSVEAAESAEAEASAEAAAAAATADAVVATADAADTTAEAMA